MYCTTCDLVIILKTHWSRFFWRMSIKKFTTKLENDKTPGLNSVPLRVSKTIDDKNITWLILFYNQFRSIQAYFDIWNEGQVFLLPSKVETSNTNKCRGFTLMYIRTKIHISIMCEQLFKVIRKNGVKYQFGSTLEVRCQDVTFIIKTFLHIRHNHNISTWVTLWGLIKFFNTSKHALLITILVKYGAPPRLCSAIKQMYNKSVVKLITNNIETSMNWKVGFKQGYSMDPVLFMFLIMIFFGTLEYMDCPGTKQIPICTQIQLAKINRTPSEPPTWRIYIRYALLSIMHALYRRRRICIWIQDQLRKMNNPPLWPFRSICPWNIYWHEKTSSKTECILFPYPGFFNTQT